jgi:hypothetical protein
LEKEKENKKRKSILHHPSIVGSVEINDQSKEDEDLNLKIKAMK